MPGIAHGSVCLRPWLQDDAEALIGITQCAHVHVWLKDWANVDEWATQWIEGQKWRHEKGDPEREFMSWAITVPPSDLPVGVINLGGDETAHRGVSLGYFLHTDALHKGYATEAVLALCRYVFDRWDFVEILASVRVENAPSRAVLERAGFVFMKTVPMRLSGYEQEVSCAWYGKAR